MLNQKQEQQQKQREQEREQKRQKEQSIKDFIVKYGKCPKGFNWHIDDMNLTGGPGIICSECGHTLSFDQIKYYLSRGRYTISFDDIYEFIKKNGKSYCVPCVGFCANDS